MAVIEQILGFVNGIQASINGALAGVGVSPELARALVSITSSVMRIAGMSA